MTKLARNIQTIKITIIIYIFLLFCESYPSSSIDPCQINNLRILKEFILTERNYGKSQNDWVGIVTNVKDPDMDGRVQVRVHGQHDDQTNIPDTDLPWSKPEQDI